MANWCFKFQLLLNFVAKYRNYFSVHDLTRLPSQFVDRLGELSKAQLGTDTIESLNFASQAFTEAKQYAWGIGEGTIPGNMNSVMNQRVQEGVQIKMLISQERLPTSANMPPLPKNVDLRGLSELPAIIVLTEKVAGICFHQTGGKVDYAGFFGSDSTYHNWVKDLFIYYWEKSKRA